MDRDAFRAELRAEMQKDREALYRIIRRPSEEPQPQPQPSLSLGEKIYFGISCLSIAIYIGLGIYVAMHPFK